MQQKLMHSEISRCDMLALYWLCAHDLHLSLRQNVSDHRDN